ncbi:hypothetical protein CHS0354_038972 [Potamilus streckersoni]|uniref:dolichyl-phosphate-mannose--protein mannosyltransferase n=1 Tax=Potamilus streckersoni TaxID=2493646 RepID=A0AAE0S0Z2_9BIVA|nr:hypothetical protein CHS0354_038972 [Potamilus streckersoni]
MRKVQMNGTLTHFSSTTTQNGVSKQNGVAYTKQNGVYTKHNGDSCHQQMLQKNPENFLPIPRLKFRSAAVLVFTVSVVCFCSSYDGNFVFDDSEAIVNNKDLLPESSITDLFYHDFWGNKLDSKTSHKSYRPLTVLTYRFSHVLSGGLNPIAFHVPNIVLNAIISVLILGIFSILFGGYALDTESGRPLFSAPKSALLCAVLFAVHPVHTESVAGVVGRADLLCALLFLLSFYLYIKACAKSPYEEDDKLIVYRPEVFSVPLLLTSMVLCCLSVLCKEQGITVIGLCSVYDIIVICRVDFLRLVGIRTTSGNNGVNGNNQLKEKDFRPWVLSLIKRHIFLFLTAVAILVFRWRIMGSTPPTFQVFDNPHSFTNGTFIRALNYNYLYSINAWLLINPWWLCFDWSMGCIPVIQTVSDPRNIATGAFWIVMAFLIYNCVKGQITQDQRTLTIALAFIVVPFLPASNIFFRVGFVIAERILYLSSAGFCMLIVLGVRYVCVNYQQFIKMIKLFLAFLIGICMIRCVQRSIEWKDEMSLFVSGVKVCPGNAKVHYNIAKLNADRGNTDYAIEEYRLAIELNPEYDQAMNNLGNIMKDKGDLDEAEQLLETAVKIREEFAAAWMNLGIVKSSLKKYQESERCYLTAIKHRRKYPDCYYNLGNLYLEQKLHTEALQAWMNATKLKPTHVNSWSNAIVLLDNLGQYKEAEVTTKEALKYLPNESQIYFNMANIYGKMERYQESEQFFLKAIQLQNNEPKYYGNLGVLYHRWNKLKSAETMYKKALTLNPSDMSSRDNLEMLYQKMQKLKN